MKILEFYDGKKIYMYPTGKIADVNTMLEKCPAILTFKHVIETDEAGEVCFAIENFSAMRTRFNIDKTLGEEEALAAIQEIINIEPEEVVSAEERIAAALEYQNMVSMEDVEVIE